MAAPAVLKMADARVILHADLDAFFAAVEIRDNPSLAGKPVIVGGTGEDGSVKGIVSTCSYEARKFGIRSAMPIITAKRLCPDAIIIRPNGQKYAKASREVFEIFYSYTPVVEPLSIDEAFLDITGTRLLFGPPKELAQKIKHDVLNKTGLTVSIGIAPNKSVAKIASDLSKPDGLIIVKENEILNFLHPLPISKLWGIGPKAAKMLESKAIRTIGDFARTREELLTYWFQSRGPELLLLANGVDNRPVETFSLRKSISKETTFPEPLSAGKELQKELLELSEKTAFRLRSKGLKAKTIGVKLRFPDLSYTSKVFSLGQATDASTLIYKTALKLLTEINLQGKKVRLLGVRLAGLEETSAPSGLFVDENLVKEAKKDKAVDSLRKQFGFNAVIPASLLKPKNADSEKTKESDGD